MRDRQASRHESSVQVMGTGVGRGVNVGSASNTTVETASVTIGISVAVGAFGRIVWQAMDARINIKLAANNLFMLFLMTPKDIFYYRVTFCGCWTWPIDARISAVTSLPPRRSVHNAPIV